jgi:hypothetical protein
MGIQNYIEPIRTDSQRRGAGMARISYLEAPSALYLISLNSRVLDFKSYGTIRYISIRPLIGYYA